MPLEHPPSAIFCGDSDLGKIFFYIFLGIEPTTPTPHAGPSTLPRHFGLPSLAPPRHVNQNPEVAGETCRQLAKNAPIDMNQTVKQVPNTPPGGGGKPLLKWVSNQGGQNSQIALAHCVAVRACCNAVRSRGSQDPTHHPPTCASCPAR
jgi:hypothetical protein